MEAPAPRRIALLCTLGNPLATAWLLALQAAGHEVAVVDLRDRPGDDEALRGWAVPEGTVVTTGGLTAPRDMASQITSALDGPPDLLLGWWGRGVLDGMVALRPLLQRTAFLHVVDTFPDASNWLAAAREVLRYARAAPAVDGWIHFSPRMRTAFVRRVPTVRHDPWVAIWEAFPSTAFSDGGSVREPSGPPSLVYSGRTDLLWGRDPRMGKDAQGPFLVELERLGVQVTVSDWDGADLGGHEFATYPRFSNAEMLDGTFARHMDGFDVQLVAYRECNRTIRRRVASGLSTRLASALTSTSPVAVSSSSTFVCEEWARTGERWGLTFTTPESLAAGLHDRAGLQRMRAHMAAAHGRYALDQRMASFGALADHVLRVGRGGPV